MLLPSVTGRNGAFLMYIGKRDTPERAGIAVTYHTIKKAVDRELIPISGTTDFCSFLSESYLVML